MFIVKYYVIGALASFLIAWSIPTWYFSLAFAWLGVSLSVVSAAYVLDIPNVFRKGKDGAIPWYIMWILLPFFYGVQLYNSWARKKDAIPAIQEIIPNLYLGCRLYPSDIEYLERTGVSAILDATSEFNGLNWSAKDSNLAYTNVPILAHCSPHQDDLKRAVDWISQHIGDQRGVVVHCALGRGRSVLIIAAYLLASGRFDSVDKALAHINSIRETAQLNEEQYGKLALMHEQGALSD
jgi:hypothetical protein